MGKKDFFERMKKSDDQRTAEEQRSRGREMNRPGTGLFKRVEQARKQSGVPLYRRDTQN